MIWKLVYRSRNTRKKIQLAFFLSPYPSTSQYNMLDYPLTTFFSWVIKICFLFVRSFFKMGYEEATTGTVGIIQTRKEPRTLFWNCILNLKSLEDFTSSSLSTFFFTWVDPVLGWLVLFLLLVWISLSCYISGQTCCPWGFKVPEESTSIPTITRCVEVQRKVRVKCGLMVQKILEEIYGIL